MANLYDTVPNNFGTPLSPTYYLDLAGLTKFWANTKDYIDSQDAALYAKASADLKSADSAMRDYVETLTVNGIKVNTDATYDADGNPTKLGTTLDVEITGKEITVGENGGDTYKNSKVDAAIAGVDTRLTAVETELNEGVVNQLTITATHDDDASDTAKEWLKVTTGTGAQTGNVVVDFDDTAIDQKFEDLDAEISDLIANAGVTNVKVVDVDKDGAVRKGLVEISLDGTKDGTVNGDTAFERGDITITLDETVLDEALDEIDTTIANEVADRKSDVAALAGVGYTVSADGKADGAWEKTADGAFDKDAEGKGFTVKYRDISSISERLADIDVDLVTKITEGTSTENFVTLEVGGADGSGDKEITITLNDSALKEYTDKNEENLSALNGLSINGESLITVTDGDQVTVTATNVTLDASQINRQGKETSIEAALTEHDEKLRALVEATEFVGVVSWDPSKVTISEGVDDNGVTDYTINGDNVPAGGVKMQNGDIILTADGKEYILDAHADGGAKFVELGDTTAEQQRLSKLETWVDTNYITAEAIDALFTGIEKPSFGA